MTEPVWEGGWWGIETAPVNGYFDLWHTKGYRVPDVCRATPGQRNVGWLDQNGAFIPDDQFSHWRTVPVAPAR